MATDDAYWLSPARIVLGVLQQNERPVQLSDAFLDALPSLEKFFTSAVEVAEQNGKSPKPISQLAYDHVLAAQKQVARSAPTPKDVANAGYQHRRLIREIRNRGKVAGYEEDRRAFIAFLMALIPEPVVTTTSGSAPVMSV